MVYGPCGLSHHSINDKCASIFYSNPALFQGLTPARAYIEADLRLGMQIIKNPYFDSAYVTLRQLQLTSWISFFISINSQINWGSICCLSKIVSFLLISGLHYFLLILKWSSSRDGLIFLNDAVGVMDISPPLHQNGIFACLHILSLLKHWKPIKPNALLI